MHHKRLKPCPSCHYPSPEMIEREYENALAGPIVGCNLYQCTIRCTACGYRIPRISDESAEHARHAAVESWNKERI